MKKVFSLLLVLLLLLATGCKKEPEAPELGEFYTEDGVLQNTMVCAVLKTTDLTAPVTKLSYTLYDNCDLLVTHSSWSRGNDKRNDLLEILCDGEWQEAPIEGEKEGAVLYNTSNTTDPSEHVAEDLEMELSHYTETGSKLKRYAPLTEGFYRLRIAYGVKAAEGVTLPHEKAEAVIYFTVTAPAQ